MNRLQRLFFIGLLMFFNILSCTNLHWVKFVLALYLASSGEPAGCLGSWIGHGQRLFGALP